MFLKQDQTKSWAVPAVHLTRRLQRSIWRSWKAFKKKKLLANANRKHLRGRQRPAGEAGGEQQGLGLLLLKRQPNNIFMHECSWSCRVGSSSRTQRWGFDGAFLLHPSVLQRPQVQVFPESLFASFTPNDFRANSQTMKKPDGAEGNHSSSFSSCWRTLWFDKRRWKLLLQDDKSMQEVKRVEEVEEVEDASSSAAWMQHFMLWNGADETFQMSTKGCLHIDLTRLIVCLLKKDDFWRFVSEITFSSFIIQMK